MEYFLCKVKLSRVQDNGKDKMVTEQYLFDAMSFTETEARATEHVAPSIDGDFMITSISRYKISELFLDAPGDRYYRAKVDFIYIDDKGEEKRTPEHMLAIAYTLGEAKKIVDDALESSNLDYEVVKIEETPILEVVLKE